MTKEQKRKKMKHYKPIGRMLAMQFLFQFDLTDEDFEEGTLIRFFKKIDDDRICPEDIRENRKGRKYADKIIRGIIEHLPYTDNIIQKYLSADWSWQRIASIDKAILRVATYEMLFEEKVPPIVVINEGVELAKKFGSDESKAFINALLNSIKNAIEEIRKQIEK
jgi:N utilization substance protein B